MKMLNAVWASLATVTVMANSAMAATTAEEAAKLKTVLTPLGAERAGNADGSIPAWEGKPLTSCLWISVCNSANCFANLTTSHGF